MTRSPPGIYDGDPFDQFFDQTASPTHWPSIPPEELPQAWGELREWVETLVERFALDVRTVPPCWEQHNTMVEALSALRDHERGSYTEKASPTAAVDWFRAFREIEYRLTQAAARTQCSVNEHRPDPLQPLRSRAIRDSGLERRGGGLELDQCGGEILDDLADHDTG